MSEWQLIETAPKEHELLLYGPCDRGLGLYAPDRNVGWWDQAKQQWNTRTSGEVCHATHWQPLPEPPK